MAGSFKTYRRLLGLLVVLLGIAASVAVLLVEWGQATREKACVEVGVVSGIPQLWTQFRGQRHSFEETASGLLENQGKDLLVWEGECVEGSGYLKGPDYLRLVLTVPCRESFADVGQAYDDTIQGWIFDCCGPVCFLRFVGRFSIARKGGGELNLGFAGTGDVEGRHAPYWEMRSLKNARMAWIREDKPETVSDMDVSGDLRSAVIKLQILVQPGQRKKRYGEGHGVSVEPFALRPNASSEEVAKEILRTNALQLEEGQLRLIEVPRDASEGTLESPARP